MTQREAAAEKGFAYYTWRDWEQGWSPNSIPSVDLRGELKPGEQCFVYRFRTAKTKTAVSREMEISPEKVDRMERGIDPCDDLICYWES